MARRSRAELHGVEMAVKDRTRTPEGWQYYNFGGMDGIRPTAQPMPKASCYNCHLEHAARDNVFLQFYPLLAEAAHITLPQKAASLGSTSPLVAQAAPPPPSAVRGAQASIALRGLDPVMLVQGREEMGKAEIVATRGNYRYQFVSEPNRAAFASDPARFALQNSMCLVVQGAPIDPSLFVVQEGRIYGFATADCVSEFKQEPGKYLKTPK